MIDFPLFIPEKREDEKMIFYRFIKNEFNGKNYILCLDIMPAEDTLDMLGFNDYKTFETEKELREFFQIIKEAEASIEGIMLFNEDGQRFLSLK